MDDRPFRVGFLGAGGIAKVHADRLVQLGAEVVGVCSRTDASAQAFSDRYGGKALATTEFERMVDTVDLDGLVVSLPPNAHTGQVEAAARREIPMLLEKPICLTVERAVSQTEAVVEAAVPTLVGFHMRFAEPVARLRTMHRSGQAGKATLFQGQFFCNAMHSPWWADVDQSGGQLVEQAIHLYDMAAYLMGKPVSISARVENLCHRHLPGYTVEDTSAALISFEGGAVATISASNCAVPTQWRMGCRAIYENVFAEIEDLNHATMWHSGGLSSEHYFTTGEAVPTEAIASETDPYLEQARHFVAVARRQADSITPISVGAGRLRLVLAAVESARQGGAPIALD